MFNLQLFGTASQPVWNRFGSSKDVLMFQILNRSHRMNYAKLNNWILSLIKDSDSLNWVYWVSKTLSNRKLFRPWLVSWRPLTTDWNNLLNQTLQWTPPNNPSNIPKMTEQYQIICIRRMQRTKSTSNIGGEFIACEENSTIIQQKRDFISINFERRIS